MSIKPPFTKEQLAKLCQQYTSREIGEMYNIGWYSVNRYCRNWNIPTYFKQTGCYKIDGKVRIVKDRLFDIGKHYESVYSVDTTFFQTIDTEEKAWVLGMFASDGSLNKKGHVAFYQKTEEREVLEKIKNIIQFSGSVKDVVKKQSSGGISYISVLEIYSLEFSAPLKAMGYPSDKRYSNRYPFNYVPCHLDRHFLRGLWDGDGWLKKNPPDLKTVISTGSPKLMDDLDYVLKKHGFKPGRRHGKYNYCISGQRNSVPFIKWLYGDATVYHERKYKTFKEVWENVVPGRRRVS